MTRTRKTGVLKTRKLTAAQKKSVAKQKQNRKKGTGTITIPGRFTKPKKRTRK